MPFCDNKLYDIYSVIEKLIFNIFQVLSDKCSKLLVVYDSSRILTRMFKSLVFKNGLHLGYVHLYIFIASNASNSPASCAATAHGSL